jgi:hypothetical protein
VRYNKHMLKQKGEQMFTLQVLNSAPEWELVNKLFKTEDEAIAYFYAELDMFEDYEVTEMQIA